MNWKFWKKTPEPLNIAPQQAQIPGLPSKVVAECRRVLGQKSWGLTQNGNFYPFCGGKKHAEKLWAYTTPGVDLDDEEYIGFPIEDCPLAEESE